MSSSSARPAAHPTQRPSPQRAPVTPPTAQPSKQPAKQQQPVKQQPKPTQNKPAQPPQPVIERRAAVTQRPGANSVTVHNGTQGTGALVVQLAVPRMDVDKKYVVHCHILAPNERWREWTDKSFTRDIVNERIEDKQIKFTRLELVYGHAQILTGLIPGKYKFRIQSWPYGLLSDLKEFTVNVKPNETNIVSAWIHSYTPVGAINAKIYNDITKLKAVNMPPQELLARANARRVKLDKRVKSFNLTRTLAGCIRTGFCC